MVSRHHFIQLTGLIILVVSLFTLHTAETGVGHIQYLHRVNSSKLVATVIQYEAHLFITSGYSPELTVLLSQQDLVS